MPRHAQPEPLSRDRIVAAALRLIDEDGLDALSMRRLGTALGVDPMAVYHHIPNKAALLHAVVGQVFASMPVPNGRGTWQVRVRRWAESYRRLAEEHPNLVLRIVTDPGAVAVAAVQVNETLFAALDASGLSARDVVRAADVVVDYVNGFVLGAATQATVDTGAADAFRAELERQSADRVPVQRRLFADPEARAGRNTFAFGLDVIVAGLVATAASR